MANLKINQTVFSSRNGEGTIISINEDKAVVNFSGVEKIMLIMTLKTVTKSTTAKKLAKTIKKMEETTPVYNFTSIVNQIKGTRQDRGSMFAFGSSIFNTLEQLADSKGHFAGSIIEDARNGKFISDKQACVVTYFAKNNGLINA